MNNEMSVAKPAEINHELEEMMAESHGHELGCFEWIAEQIVESLSARGIAYETGAFTEVVEGKTIIETIVERLANGSAECRCPSAEIEEIAC